MKIHLHNVDSSPLSVLPPVWVQEGRTIFNGWARPSVTGGQKYFLKWTTPILTLQVKKDPHTEVLRSNTGFEIWKARDVATFRRFIVYRSGGSRIEDHTLLYYASHQPNEWVNINSALWQRKMETEYKSKCLVFLCVESESVKIRRKSRRK